MSTSESTSGTPLRLPHAVRIARTRLGGDVVLAPGPRRLSTFTEVINNEINAMRPTLLIELERLEGGRLARRF